MSAGAVYLTYVMFALGAVGVYFLAPRSNRLRGSVIGGLFGLGGLAGLLSMLSILGQPTGGTGLFFFVFATIALVGAVRVITHPRPVYAAVYFILVVVAVAGLVVAAEAEFLAIALIIVYAGAIMVTYLFVIMLAQQPASPVHDRESREPFWAVLAGFVLTGAIAGQAGSLPQNAGRDTIPVVFLQQASPGSSLAIGHTSEVGALIMTRYVVVLEIAGLLLLISMVGAIALSRKKVPPDVFRAPDRPLGQVGKEVEPF